MINELTKQDISWYNSALKQNDIINLDEYKEDIDKNTQLLFKESLKMHRRQMTPRVRELTSKQVIRDVRLYPFADERQYRLYIQDIMNVYADIAMPTVRQNIERWVDEFNADSLNMDDFNDEFQRMITEMNQAQSDMFDTTGDGVEGRKNFYNRVAIFSALASFGISISRFNKKQQDKITKRILGQPFSPSEPWLEDVLTLWSNDNFGLIKSLSSEYIKKVNTIVSTGIADGNTWDKIMRDMRGMNKNMTKSRATLIARDQTGKLNGRLTKRRNQEAGISLYQWFTALDERVRSKHKVLHNRIMRWDDNTVYADSVADAKAGKWKSRSSISGYVGIPGSDVQCRCSSGTVFVDIIEEVDKELKGEEAFKDIDKRAEERKQKELEKKRKKTPQRKKKVKPKKEELPVIAKKKRLPISEEAAEKRIKENVTKFEDEVKGNNFETAAAYDDVGNELLRKKGKEHEVTFTKAEQNKIEGARVITHNHPGFVDKKTGVRRSTSFSEDDIQFDSIHNIRESRAVINLEGKQKITYSMDGVGDMNQKRVKELIKVRNEEVSILSKRLAKDRRKLKDWSPVTPKEMEKVEADSWRRAVNRVNITNEKKLKYRRIVE